MDKKMRYVNLGLMIIAALALLMSAGCSEQKTDQMPQAPQNNVPSTEQQAPTQEGSEPKIVDEEKPAAEVIAKPDLSDYLTRKCEEQVGYYVPDTEKKKGVDITLLQWQKAASQTEAETFDKKWRTTDPLNKDINPSVTPTIKYPLILYAYKVEGKVSDQFTIVCNNNGALGKFSLDRIKMNITSYR